MKLNLGCGNNKKEGYVNIDFAEACNPDLVWDLEKTPWPFEDNSVDEILAYHVLEHIGQDTKVYLAIIKELYRICKNGAIIKIQVPHPRSDNFLTDPTHVRPITPEGLGMFDQEFNRHCIANNWATTPLGIYLGVNFKVINTSYELTPYYATLLAQGKITQDQVMQYLRTYNNVCENINIELKVVKS